MMEASDLVSSSSEEDATRSSEAIDRLSAQINENLVEIRRCLSEMRDIIETCSTEGDSLRFRRETSTRLRKLQGNTNSLLLDTEIMLGCDRNATELSAEANAGQQPAGARKQLFLKMKSHI